MSDIEDVLNKLRKFRDERDWGQFHNSKDLAIAISIEASELMELFLWKEAKEADSKKIKEELADILNYAFLMAEKHGFDIQQIMLEKLESNAKKYPTDKAKGTAKKYTDL